MNDPAPELTGFQGIARLFPLPNVVLFPHVPLPLHIFEDRYRQMTADALAGDQLITMVLLQDGWQGDYQGNPSLYEVGCLGKVVHSQRRPDGRYDLILLGLRRVRIQAELPSSKLYRTAHVELLEDQNSVTDSGTEQRRLGLMDRARESYRLRGWDVSQLDVLLEPLFSLSDTADLLASNLGLTIRHQQTLLEELDVERRARLLIEYLTQADETFAKQEAKPFPPPFSAN